MMPRTLVALIVTHQRPVEMARLLEGLEKSTRKPDLCIVSDHAPGGDSKKWSSWAGLRVRVLEDPSNPGPGAGWANAAAANDLPDSDLLFLDDDVVLGEGAIAGLSEFLGSADCVAPLLSDESGRLWGFPEPEDVRLRALIRKAGTPAEALELMGPGPHRMCWCTGACVLTTSEFYKKIGPHRRDFWMLGEDLEFSMRAATHGRAVFSCAVTVPHLPPPGPGTPVSNYIKFCSLLQNLCYLSGHSPNSQHMFRYLPGNFRRFVRTFGISPRTLRDGWTCFSGGLIFGEPAGTPRGTALRQRVRELMS